MKKATMISYQVSVGERARRCKNGEEREKERETGKRGQPTNGSFTEWPNSEMYIRVNGISQSDVKLLLRLVYKLYRSFLCRMQHNGDFAQYRTETCLENNTYLRKSKRQSL